MLFLISAPGFTNITARSCSNNRALLQLLNQSRDLIGTCANTVVVNVAHLFRFTMLIVGYDFVL